MHGLDAQLFGVRHAFQLGQASEQELATVKQLVTTPAAPAPKVPWGGIIGAGVLLFMLTQGKAISRQFATRYARPPGRRISY